MKYHTISYHIISYHIISYHIIPYHTISYHIIPYHTIPYHVISYHHGMSHDFMACHTISWHVTRFHGMSHDLMACHTISWHVIGIRLSDINVPCVLFHFCNYRHGRTNQFGNAEVPFIPTDGLLSYPYRGKHLWFDGALQHGVHPQLAQFHGEFLNELTSIRTRFFI